QMADLRRRLLARTLIVRDLATARALAVHTAGYRFITLQGELLEADGTLTIGTHHAETGILSRRSELRELREQAAGLDERLAEIERHLADLGRDLTRVDAETKEMQQHLDGLSREEADLRERVVQHRESRERLHARIEDSRTEMDLVEQ